jgi:hypothetical protein
LRFCAFFLSHKKKKMTVDPVAQNWTEWLWYNYSSLGFLLYNVPVTVWILLALTIAFVYRKLTKPTAVVVVAPVVDTQHRRSRSRSHRKEQ